MSSSTFAQSSDSPSLPLTTFNHPSHETHLFHLRLALLEAEKCIPTPTAFCVGALLVNPSTTPFTLLSTGYSRELPGNTHAEQCALEKITALYDVNIPDDCALYTTMEPCSERLSGNKTCVDRILEFGKIKMVFVGVTEPETFVKKNVGLEKLRAEGIEYVHVSGLEKECLEVAERGHVVSELELAGDKDNNP